MIITLDEKKEIYTLSLFNEDYPNIMNNPIPNILEVKVREGYYYLLKSQRNRFANEDGSYTLSFTDYCYYEGEILNRFEYSSKVISYTLDAYLLKTLSNINGRIIKEEEFELYFSVVGTSLSVEISGNKELINTKNIGSSITYFLFLLTGKLYPPNEKEIYISDEGKLYHYYTSIFRGLKLMRYTRFATIIDEDDFIEGFQKFLEFYSDNKYSTEIFMQTQLSITGNIQSRFSSLMNSLEGIIKQSEYKEKFKLSITKANKKKILKSIKENTEEYMNSDEFIETLYKLTGDEQEKYIERLKSSIGRFNELSLGEVLSLSIEVNIIGNKFIESIISDPDSFWEKCMDHRNFHAHPTSNKYKGFSGFESLISLYVLSNFVRTFILKLCSMSKNINIESIDKEIESIKEWKLDVENFHHFDIENFVY